MSVAPTPPMGWRDWNQFQGAITQDLMEAQMIAQAARSRKVWGIAAATSSLADAGYVRNGLDDAWQACHAGANNSFHDASGLPLVNLSRFPDMKAMTAKARALHLSPGFYVNNCICGEGRLPRAQSERDVAGNVAFITSLGFDAVKADGCGAASNMTRLAQLLAETGRDVLIENCHYNKLGPGEPRPKGVAPDPGRNRIWPYWRNNITGGELVCPEHTFRASGDIRNSWNSWFSNLHTLAKYADVAHPISQPDCWANADMLMIGVMETAYCPKCGPAASVAEWRSHFGAWCIASSPLMLSFDMTNATTMDAVWPFVTNVEAIAVNQAWAGHPGLMVNATRCANATASGGGGGGGSGGVDVEIWVKPMLAAKKNGKKQGKRLALFVVSQERPGPSSAVAVDIDVDIDVAALAAALALPVPGATALRDVWAHADVAGGVIGGVVKVRNLAPHDSAFYIIG